MEQEFNDLHEVLEQIQDELHENNKILRLMRREHRMANIGRILKVVIYAGLIIGSILVLKPYIDNAKRIYSTVSDQIETLGETSDKIDNASESASGFFSGFQDELGEIGDFFSSAGGGEEEESEETAQ